MSMLLSVINGIKERIDDAITSAGEPAPITYIGGANLSFVAASDDELAKIVDSSSGFESAGFVTDEVFFVMGSTSNDGLYDIAEMDEGTIWIAYPEDFTTEAGVAGTQLYVPAQASLIAQSVNVVSVAENSTISTSNNIIADNAVVRGDGGSRGIQQTGITVDDDDNVSGVDNISVSSITMINTINEVSIDGTLVGDSDSAIPTEKAVKTYVGSVIHTRQHAIDSTSDHTSTIIENNLMDADANGLPDDSGLSVTDASDAISKRHTRLHDMDDALDHNSPSGTNDNLVMFDANGYPVDDSSIAKGDVDTVQGVATSTVTVSNTVTETVLYTLSVPANSMSAGQVFSGHVSGVISNASAADDITLRLKLGSTTLETFNPAMGNVSGASWFFDGHITVRSLGVAGSAAFHGHTEIDVNEDTVDSIVTVDTTVSEDFTVTVEWDAAKAGNTISLYSGFVKVNKV